MPRTKHTVMGAFTGVFYETPAGNKLYLAHRTSRKIERRRQAWLIEESTLAKCRDMNIEAVGVIWRKNGAKRIHLTHINDFYGEHSFFKFDGVKYRGLPLVRFRIDPTKSEEIIKRSIRVR
jgi:hypothetical protein